MTIFLRLCNSGVIFKEVWRHQVSGSELLSPILKDLLRSLAFERPISSKRAPPWDLSVVLSFLRSLPFESLHASSLRDLIKKKLFPLFSYSEKEWGISRYL